MRTQGSALTADRAPVSGGIPRWRLAHRPQNRRVEALRCGSRAVRLQAPAAVGRLEHDTRRQPLRRCAACRARRAGHSPARTQVGLCVPGRDASDGRNRRSGQAQCSSAARTAPSTHSISTPVACAGLPSPTPKFVRARRCSRGRAAIPKRRLASISATSMATPMRWTRRPAHCSGRRASMHTRE